jgi:hypothetical protein
MMLLLPAAVADGSGPGEIEVSGRAGGRFPPAGWPSPVTVAHVPYDFVLFRGVDRDGAGGVVAPDHRDRTPASPLAKLRGSLATVTPARLC